MNILSFSVAFAIKRGGNKSKKLEIIHRYTYKLTLENYKSGCLKMQQQQQSWHCSGPLADRIATIVGLFKKCGGESAEYHQAMAQLPLNEASYVARAIQIHIATIQQQQQQLQM